MVSGPHWSAHFQETRGFAIATPELPVIVVNGPRCVMMTIAPRHFVVKRPSLRDRKFVDFLLEGDGFEPSVPG
jgi:hypothetical protein